MTKDTDTRHADMFGDEQHDGQNENTGEQYVTDSERNDITRHICKQALQTGRLFL